MNDTTGYDISAEVLLDYSTPYGKWFKEEKSRKRLTRICLMLALTLCILMVAAHIVDKIVVPRQPSPQGVAQHL